METAEEVQGTTTQSRIDESVGIQATSYLLELSLDWIVCRASENIHKLLGESHVTLIDEPLGRFVHAQALHDLRNLFSRLSGTTGIARAYGIRLTDEPELVDVAFQLQSGRVLLEAVASTGSFGESFGSVGGLAAGLAGTHAQALLDNGGRRMRALTGYDRVTLRWGTERAQSTRGAFDGQQIEVEELPAIVADAATEAVPIFPRVDEDSAASRALMHGCSESARSSLAVGGISACLRIPFVANGVAGEFRCDSRRAREPNFEMHAAAELFAQLFAMRLEMDRLGSGA